MSNHPEIAKSITIKYSGFLYVKVSRRDNVLLPGIQPLDIQPTLLLFISFSLTFMIIHSLQFATNEVRALSNYLLYRVASSIFSVKGFRKFFIQDVFTQYSFHIQSVCLKLVCIPLCLNILIRQH